MKKGKSTHMTVNRIQFCSGVHAAPGIHGNGKLNLSAAPGMDAEVQTSQHVPLLWWWLLRSPGWSRGPSWASQVEGKDLIPGWIPVVPHSHLIRERKPEAPAVGHSFKMKLMLWIAAWGGGGNNVGPPCHCEIPESTSLETHLTSNLPAIWDN